MAGLNAPIVVVEESPSGLIRQRWVFRLQGCQMLLDRYHYERRHALSQDFKTTKFYDRERLDGEDYGSWTWLDESEVPWDDDLKTEALAQLAQQLVVGRQSDFTSQ